MHLLSHRVSFTKLFTLFVRIFSKPMVGYVKTLQIEPRGESFTSFFQWIGQRWHRFEYRLNRLVQEQQNKQEFAPPKPLSAEVAAAKGVETFYEMVFYAIAIGIPMYEYNKSSKSAQQKEEVVNRQLERLDADMLEVHNMIQQHLLSTT